MNVRIEVVSDHEGPGVNEDAFLAEPRVWGVFDGATALVEPTGAAETSSGRRAAALARAAFADDDGAAALDALARRANDAIAAEMRRAGVPLDVRVARWCTTAAVARVRGGALEWLVVGDSRVVVVDPRGAARALGSPVDHDRSTKLLALTRPPAGVLRAHMIEVRRRANVSYGALNGDPGPVAFAEAGAVPLADVRDVIVLSDGALLPKADVDAPDDLAALAARVLADGPAAWAAAVRALERDDAACMRYPRLKPHDDLTVVAVTGLDGSR